MLINFEIRKSIHLLLFVIQSLGGRAHPDKIFILFYLADMQFLSLNGVLGFGSFYLAMKSGPVPYNIFWLLMELNNTQEGNISAKIRHYIAIDEEGFVISSTRYDLDYLSAAEVENMFATIHKYKNAELHVLKQIAMGQAWSAPDPNGIIRIVKMEEECNANNAINAAIKSRNDYIQQSGVKTDSD